MTSPTPVQHTKPPRGDNPQNPPYWSDILSTRWLPKAPPKLMATFEGWGYDSLPDLLGKVYIVTGGSAGIGFEATRELAKHGAHVIIASPDPERAKAAIQEIKDSVSRDLTGRIEYIHLDLASLESIKRFADHIMSRSIPLHGLVCNAAVQGRMADITEDGMEQRWGSNFVGHFYLAHLLLGRLGESTPSRLVFVSSMEEQNGKIPWEDPLGMNAPVHADWYSSSKMANLMIALEMSRRLQGTGIDCFAVHPGVAQTEIFSSMAHRSLGFLYRQAMQAIAGQSAYRGALPLVYAAAEPKLTGKGGQFIGPRYYGYLCFQAYSFSSLSPRNKEANSEHARYRLYEQTVDALEALLKRPMPNRLRGVPLSVSESPRYKEKSSEAEEVAGGMAVASKSQDRTPLRAEQ